MICIIKNKPGYLSFVFMFKRITALVFLLTFAAQSFSAPFIVLDYYAHTDAYARNCINKARPKMHCNGKCQVMKKMKEAEKKEQENSQRTGGAKNEVLSSRSFYPSLINPELVNLAAVKNAAYCNVSVTDRPTDFFHPPQVM